MVVAGRTALPGPSGDRAFSKPSRAPSNAPIGPLIAKLASLSPDTLQVAPAKTFGALDDGSKNRELQP